MTSLKDRLAVYVAHLLGRKNVSTDDYEDAQALLALLQQEVMAALPKKSYKAKRAYRIYSNDFAAVVKEEARNQAISDMESRLKERLELAPTSKEVEDE